MIVDVRPTTNPTSVSSKRTRNKFFPTKLAAVKMTNQSVQKSSDSLTYRETNSEKARRRKEH
jgi:hypothetical protein